MQFLFYNFCGKKIKTWTITKKQTLFLLLSEHDSDEIAEYFNDLIKKK